jgi:hypothetical protein
MPAKVGPKRVRALARAGCYFDSSAAGCDAELFDLRRERWLRSCIASEAKQSILSFFAPTHGLLRFARNAVDTVSHSRGADHPRFASSFGLFEIEGAGKTGLLAASAVSCASAQTKNAHEHTGSAETLRPSLRSGFTACSELSAVSGSFATVAPKKLASRELDASADLGRWGRDVPSVLLHRPARRRDLPVGQVRSRFVKRATRRIAVRTQYHRAFGATKLIVVEMLERN